MAVPSRDDNPEDPRAKVAAGSQMIVDLCSIFTLFIADLSSVVCFFIADLSSIFGSRVAAFVSLAANSVRIKGEVFRSVREMVCDEFTFGAFDVHDHHSKDVARTRLP